MKSYTEFKSSSADRDPCVDHTSGVRSAMGGGHTKSAVPLDKPEPTMFFTGADTELAKYLFNTIAEDDGHVCNYVRDGIANRAIFQRFSKRGDPNPLQTAIFIKRLDGDGKGHDYIDVILTSGYTDHDHVFTSPQYDSDKLKDIIRNKTDVVSKGDNITTLNCLVDGEFCDGVNIRTVNTSHPEIIEDSYVISESAAAAMHGYGYSRILINVKADEFLLDKYGKQTIYGWKPGYFPEIGEAIRDDGLVVAKRDFDPLYAAIDMMGDELQKHSPFYDRCEYVDADPEHYKNPSDLNGSRVIDIKVWRNEAGITKDGNTIPCTVQNKDILDDYAHGLKKFYEDILHFYFSIDNDNIVWGPKAIVLINDALASECSTVYPIYQDKILSKFAKLYNSREINEDPYTKIKKKLPLPTERTLRDPIDTYQIELVVRYPIPCTVSSKITDRYGTKGIVGSVYPDDQMPYDEFGRTVHALRSMNATMRRSTYSVLFIQYWSDANEQFKIRIKDLIDKGDYDTSWKMFLSYLDKYNPDYTNVIRKTHDTTEKRIELFKEMYDKHIRIWMPHELDNTALNISDNLGEFAPKKTRLCILNYKGEREWTKNKFYAGPVETIRLDKTGREFSSISSMFTNFLGTIDSSNNSSSNYPTKHKAIKFGGEAERRLTTAYCKDIFDEIHNRANTPSVHRAMVRGLYRQNTPTNPTQIIDRNVYKLGDSQIDRIVYNVHLCEGLVLVKPKKD